MNKEQFTPGSMKIFNERGTPNANLISASPDMYEALKKLEINLIVLANDARTPKVISGLIYGFLEDSQAKAALNKANPQA